MGVFLTCAVLGLSAALPACGSHHGGSGTGQGEGTTAEQSSPLIIVRGLEEPLVPTKPTTEAEDKAVQGAAESFRTLAPAPQDGDLAAFAPLEAFVAAHPHSGWSAAVLTDLGLAYYHAGYFSRAFDALTSAWSEGKAATVPQGRALVDRAVGELAKMHARVGHADALEALFKDMGDRAVTGSATELVTGAKEGVWVMRNEPGIAYLCGPKALKNVLLALGGTADSVSFLDDERSGEHGYSLAQVDALADKAGLDHRLIFRAEGQGVPVPSVVNWKVHHYAAIVGEENGRYHVQDPTFGGDLWVSKDTIDAEASGFFLVPSSDVQDAAWREATPDEAEQAYGMGYTSSTVAGATTPWDIAVGAFYQALGLAPPEHPTDAACTRNGNPVAMCEPTAHAMNVSLNIKDTPVGYAPQVGPAAFVRLVYSQREASQPATFTYFNVGQKWTLNVLSYVQDIPNSPGTSVTRYVGGGGDLAYTGYSSGNFTAERQTGAVLTRTPSTGTLTSYTITSTDGSQLVYSQVDGAVNGNPRKVFLTSIKDPQGNALTLAYDGSLRLTTITDAASRVTTLGYSGASLQVSTITDPFGRAASLAYDGSNRLSSITDVIGITSSFHYDGSGLIDQLTTPYGTTNFAYGGTAPTRYLETTDPLGNTERLEFAHSASGINASDPSGSVPSGMNASNGYFNYRNSFYWDKSVYPTYGTGAGKDYTKAHIWQWLHTAAGQTSPTLNSIKHPLENRIWYDYAGQGWPYVYEGTSAAPAHIGRVLDDGTTQLQTATYNALGKPLTVTDPLGRVTRYTYASNNVDLTLVEQKTGASTYSNIAQYAYDSAHNVLTKTDAAGKVWRYCYNSAGQLTQAIDPANYVSGSSCGSYGSVGTRYTYDGSGRLTTITDAAGNTFKSSTYSGTCGGGSFINCDVPATVTDSEGRTLTYARDALDRVTSTTYPDSTTDLYSYTGAGGNHKDLDLLSHTDRLSRVTSYTYDNNRRQTQVTDPLSHTVQYGYYANGALNTLTDQNSHTTTWTVDIQSRPTVKTFADSKTITYAYESTTSRPHTVTDALSQVKTYSYDKANELTGIAYTNEVVSTPDVTFTWDTYFPRRTGMTDGNGSTAWSYVAPGTNGALSVDTENGPFSNDSAVYAYDADGRVSSLTAGGTTAETFAYDALGRVSSHVTLLGTFSYGYLGETGQVSSRGLGGTSISSSWSYDTNANDRRMTAITHNSGARSYGLSYGSSPVNVYTLMRDAETSPGGHPYTANDWVYSYDSADRLLTQGINGGSTTYTFAYDSATNLTTLTGKTSTVNPTYNSVNQVSTSGFTYNDAGDTTADAGVHTYTWDAEDRIHVITLAGTNHTVTFTYDGLGRRVQTDYYDGSTTTVARFHWCGGEMCARRNGSDVVSRRYYEEGQYWTGGTPIKLVTCKDPSGNVRDVVDVGTGARVKSWDWTPYGEEKRTSGSGSPDFLFGGLYWDTNSSLYYSATRVYDQKAGRFITRDPIAESGGVNLYAYAGGNPIMQSDPSGLCATDWSTILKNAFWYDNPIKPAAEVLSLFYGGVGIAALGTRLLGYAVTAEGAVYFHYGYAADAALFEGGILAGRFATTEGGLTAVEAQEGLSLPGAILRDARYTVTPKARTLVTRPTPAAPQFGQPGGLPEVQFPWGTTPGTVSSPIPIL